MRPSFPSNPHPRESRDVKPALPGDSGQPVFLTPRAPCLGGALCAGRALSSPWTGSRGPHARCHLGARAAWLLPPGPRAAAGLSGPKLDGAFLKPAIPVGLSSACRRPPRGSLSLSRAAARGGVPHVPQRPVPRSLRAAVTELAPQGLCVPSGGSNHGEGGRRSQNQTARCQTASAHLRVGQHWSEQ